jgi:putative inorganic carbon (HCO3(-)) transporter
MQGRLSLTAQLKFLLLIPILIIIALPLFSYSGIDIVAFIQERLLAFTDYQTDTTANWRVNYWMAILQKIKAKPLLGTGFGAHFAVYVPELGHEITTSAHNLYLSIIYQIGVIGLLIYLSMLASIILQLKRARPNKKSDKVIIGTSALILLAVHFYGIGYTFEKEFFTWTFMGLLFSYFVNERSQRCRDSA